MAKKIYEVSFPHQGSKFFTSLAAAKRIKATEPEAQIKIHPLFNLSDI